MRIGLAPDIEKKLRRALGDAGRREIGGMLFAQQLAPAHFRIVDFSTDNFSGSHTHFKRDPAIHAKSLEEFFDRTDREYGRFNYLGEWHSHPSFAVAPSFEDITTMSELVEDGSNNISFALLLIVRLRFRFWMDYSLTVFAKGYQPYRGRIAPRWI